jgi:hypothetical protein
MKFGGINGDSVRYKKLYDYTPDKVSYFFLSNLFLALKIKIYFRVITIVYFFIYQSLVEFKCKFLLLVISISSIIIRLVEVLCCLLVLVLLG